VLMNAGKVEQVGTPVELYATPATEFGARFVGANNLLKAKLAAGGAAVSATVDGLAQPIPLTTVSRQIGGTDIWCCIRPEHIRIGHVDSSSSKFEARVVDKVYQGTTVLIDFEIPGIERLRAERPASEAERISTGDTVQIGFERTHAVARQPAD